MAIHNREARKITIGQPHTPDGLPRLSLVLSRADGQHTSVTVYPTDAAVRDEGELEFYSNYVREMLAFARGRYRGEVT